MPSKSEEFFTRRDMARRFGVPDHRVKWVLESRKIEPAHRPGGRAIYDADAVQKVRLGLQETSERWTPVPDRTGLLTAS